MTTQKVTLTPAQITEAYENAKLTADRFYQVYVNSRRDSARWEDYQKFLPVLDKCRRSYEELTGVKVLSGDESTRHW